EAMRVIFAALSVLLFAGSLLAFEAVGTIKSVDAEKGVVHINAGGQDRTVPVAKDLKVLGTDGNPLPDGLKAKELKEGAEVTITVEKGDGGPIIHAIRLGKQGRDRKDVKEGGKPSVGLKPL